MASPLDGPSGSVRKARKQVKRACSNCRRAKIACSASRPCVRCVSQHKQDTCRDMPRRTREKKSAGYTSKNFAYADPSGVGTSMNFHLETSPLTPTFFSSGTYVSPPTTSSTTTSPTLSATDSQPLFFVQQPRSQPVAFSVLPSPPLASFDGSQQQQMQQHHQHHQQQQQLQAAATHRVPLGTYSGPSCMGGMKVPTDSPTQLVVSPHLSLFYHTLFNSQEGVSYWKIGAHGVCHLLDYSAPFRSLLQRTDMELKENFICYNLYRPIHHGKTSALLALIGSGRIASVSAKLLFNRNGEDVPVMTVMHVRFDETGTPTHLRLVTQDFDAVASDVFFQAFSVKLKHDERHGMAKVAKQQSFIVAPSSQRMPIIRQQLQQQQQQQEQQQLKQQNAVVERQLRMQLERSQRELQYQQTGARILQPPQMQQAVPEMPRWQESQVQEGQVAAKEEEEKTDEGEAQVEAWYSNSLLTDLQKKLFDRKEDEDDEEEEGPVTFKSPSVSPVAEHASSSPPSDPIDPIDMEMLHGGELRNVPDLLALAP